MSAPEELIEILIDKALETRHIANLGVPLPKTVQELPTEPEALIESCGLPLIVKPRYFKYTKTIGAKNRICTTPDQVRELYEQCAGMLHHLVAQEVIPGNDETQWVAHASFGKGGKWLGGFSFRRLGLAPSHFGVTSYAISEYNDEVLRLSRVIGEKLGYRGPAMIEFKFDSRDNTYKYIELNPRLAMVNSLASRCGFDTALAAYYVALDREGDIPKFQTQREGVIYLDFYDDLYARIKDGQSLFGVLRHYASNGFKPHVGAYLSWDDPTPGIAIGWYNATRTLTNLVGKFT